MKYSGGAIFQRLERFFQRLESAVALDESGVKKHYFHYSEKEFPMTGTHNMIISKILMAGSALSISMVCLAEVEYKPERYDVILDRAPFGADPLLGVPAPDTTVKDAAAAAKAAADAAKELRLCFLLESESGEIRAGFENKKAKKGESKSIILMVGESFMGMKLLDIDISSSQATLQNKGKSVVFELSKAPAAAKAAPKKAVPQRRLGGGFRKPPPKAPEKPPEPQLSPEEQKQRRDEIRANLQNYQMEVIRSGMPPLPIPLTQEMDDQLVTEGILPPEQ